MASILFVEDEPLILDNLCEIFTLSGFEVKGCLNGQLALDYLGEITDVAKLPNLIVTDLMMPIMDGFSLLKVLKSSEVYKPIPVVVLSAKSDTTDLELAFETGAADYLVKPFELDELFELVTKQLGDYARQAGDDFNLTG